MIFLSFIFYVKSILGSLEVKNLHTIVAHLVALNFDFYDFLHFLETQTYKINKIQSPKKWQKRQL